MFAKSNTVRVLLVLFAAFALIFVMHSNGILNNLTLVFQEYTVANVTNFTNDFQTPRPLILFGDDQRQGVNITYSTVRHTRKCAMKGRIIVANYGSHGIYIKLQKVSCQSALKFGADACVSFSPDFLDPVFKERNRHILENKFGVGLWIWKPYIIFNLLLAMEPGDVLFYLDRDFRVISSIEPYICFQDQLGQDVITFYQPYQERPWTTQDAVFLMGMENKTRVMETAQVRGGFHFIRRTPQAIRFVGEWLTYVQDERIVSSTGNLIKKNTPGFYQNRHDQTVFSLLSKRWNWTVFPNPAGSFSRNNLHYGTLYAYNPVDVDLPNHPVHALIVQNKTA